MEIKGCFAEPEVRPSFSGFHLSRSSACWTVDDVQHVGGEITKEFETGDFERSPPHLFLYLFLLKRKNNGGNKQGLYQF